MLKSNNQNKLTIFLMSCMIQNIFFVYKKGTLMVIKVTYCEKLYQCTLYKSPSLSYSYWHKGPLITQPHTAHTLIIGKTNFYHSFCFFYFTYFILYRKLYKLGFFIPLSFFIELSGGKWYITSRFQKAIDYNWACF